MKASKRFSPTEYSKLHPVKAAVLKKAVKQGIKQYAVTFRKLAGV